MERVPSQFLFGCLVLLCAALCGSAARGQPTLAAGGMITPKDATTAAEIVVVQMNTPDERPSPPFVVSLAPPRLALPLQAEPSGTAGSGFISSNVGRLAAGAWQVHGYRVDWKLGGGEPQFEGFSGPGEFYVTRGEVYPTRLHPLADQPFKLRLKGSWSSSCLPEIDRITIEQGPTVVLHGRRTDALCASAEDAEDAEDDVPFQTDVAIESLPAGGYEAEVRIPSADGSVEVFARASFRLEPAGAPRILELRIDDDLDRNVHLLVARVEIPVTPSGAGCASWNVRAGNAWAHGRDLYAPFEVEPTVAACGPGKVATFRLPLPELESGLYRILALQQRAGSLAELWAQSPTLLQLRELRRLIDGRFEVTVTWRDHRGKTDRAIPVAASQLPSTESQSAIFYFFSEDNWELLVKVLDGCSLNDHYWVFASASTDVEYTLEVEDLATGARVSYRNELGQASPAITDTSALATCE